MSGAVATVEEFETAIDEFDLDIRVALVTLEPKQGEIKFGCVSNDFSCGTAGCTTGSDYTCSTCSTCGCGPTQLRDSHCPCRPPG